MGGRVWGPPAHLLDLLLDELLCVLDALRLAGDGDLALDPAVVLGVLLHLYSAARLLLQHLDRGPGLTGAQSEVIRAIWCAGSASHHVFGGRAPCR